MTTETIHAARDYLASVTPVGDDCAVHPQRGRLPFALSMRHEPHRMTVNGQALALVLAAHTQPQAMARSVQLLQDFLPEPIVVIAAKLSAHQRRSLMQLGIPYLVPDAHLWLPMCSLWCKERAPRLPAKVGDSLTPAAQAILVYLCFHAGAQEHSQRALQQQLGYSAMTVKRAWDQLAHWGGELIAVTREGRERPLRLMGSVQEIWQAFQPHLVNPLMATIRARLQPALEVLPRAGISGLAAATNLTDAATTRVAVTKRDWWRCMSGVVSDLNWEGPDDQAVLVELWRYAPRLHDPQARTVDPLSLILTLDQDTRDDPRVEMAMEAMLSAIVPGHWPLS